MILSYILFKNFILNTFKHKYNIINIIIFLKQLTVIYIICYTQAILNTQLLFINNIYILNYYLKIIKFFTNNPYINNKKINNFITNWEVLKKQLILLKWVIYLIILINKNKIKLPFNNIIKLFKKFILLKNNYWTLINLQNPNYIFILSQDVGYTIFKNYFKITKYIFFITNYFYGSQYFKHSNIIVTNNLCLKLIFELIVTANIQGKYYFIKKI